jgi:acetyl esterase/lipase
MPAAIVAFSPWTDLACRGDSLEQNVERCAMFVPSQLRAAAALYAGSTPPEDPGVSPLYDALHSLPPLCLHVGRDELLRDDTLRFAQRARDAGVEVSCRCWPNVPHVWQFLAGFLPEARESLDDARDFVRQHVPARALTDVGARLYTVTESPSAHTSETRVPHE